MKKFLFIIFFIANFCCGQTINNYRVYINLYYHAHENDGNGMCETNCKVNLIYFDGNEETVIDRGQYEFQGEYAFERTSKIIGIRVIGHARRQNISCVFCNCEGANGDVNAAFYSSDCSSSYRTYTNNSDATEVDGNVTFKITPIHTLQSALVPPSTTLRETILPSEDKVTLSAKAGFEAFVYNYQYKFKTEPETAYRNISPSLFTLDKLSVSAIDLFGVNVWKTYEGQYIDFRVVSCFENGSFISKSAPVTLQVARSAPHIISSVPTDVTCFDSNDGVVKITFDRLLGCNGCKDVNKLIPGDETLNYTLLNTSTNTVVKIGNVIMNSDKTYIITGLDPGSYKINFTGFYNNAPTYASGVNHTRTFIIKKPRPVAFTTSKTNIWCNGGNDGAITINATEGTTSITKPYQYSLDGGSTWTSFTSGNTHTINNLSLGSYTLKVRDGNVCVARIQTLIGGVINLGAEKTITESISQPAAPVSINYNLVQNPTYNGGSNGKIVAAITGGTIFTNNTYAFKWKNSDGIEQTNVTTSFTGGNTFTIALNNIPAGTYFLTVNDTNYEFASQKEGCTVFNSKQVLTQPDPIEITFQVEAPSCNATNEFYNATDINPMDGERDESQDGKITATVKGGVPFTSFQNNGKPYKYFWKKQLDDGTWQPITNESPTLLNASHGKYALNVEDSKKNRLGKYNNGIFIEIDSTQFVKQPDKLEVAFTKQDVTCGNANNGWVTANTLGGIPPYRYEWNSTSSDTNSLTGLIAGNYFVRITDARGCVVQGAVNLPQPAGISIEDLSKNPNCHKGSDGSIDLKINGGRPPFTYTWNTGATTQDITNLAAGQYTIIIKDKGGCEFAHTVTLIDPNPIVVNLGADRTLCNGQSHDVDITINDPNAQYSWTSTNGFSSNKAKVNLSKAGIYHSQIVSSQGCVAEDDIEIKNTQVNIESEFFVTSQAYLDEEVMLVNTSNPFGENTQWVIPTDAVVVSQDSKFTVLKFNTTGTKTISLKQTQGDCYALYSKNITVEDRGTVANAGITNNPFIKDFIITPNPSNGKFNAIINLQDKSTVKLRLYSYIGQTAIIQKSESGQKNYVVDFNVNLPVGTYVLVLETSQQTLIRKIIIL
jgi:hypothetical protein